MREIFTKDVLQTISYSVNEATADTDGFGRRRKLYLNFPV